MSEPTGNELFAKHGLEGFPTIRTARVTTRELQTMLTEMAFPIFLRGRSYDLANRELGAGVHEVWLKRYQHVN